MEDKNVRYNTLLFFTSLFFTPTFTDLLYTYRLGISIISESAREVCRQLWSNVREYLPTPSQEDWVNISENFQRMSHFPHFIGAVDGEHIRVQKFRHSGSMNFNY